MSKKSEMLEEARQAIKSNPSNRGIMLRIRMASGEIETICNPKATEKLNYIDQAYDDALKHKSNNKISIVGYEILANQEIPLTFGIAIDMAKIGNKVRRKAWEEGTVTYVDENKIYKRDKSERVTEWLPSQEDMFATDYEIYKG